MSGQNFWSVAVRHFTTTLEKGSFFTESIRKYHHASLCCDLYSILYPEYTAISPSHKGYSWSGEGTGKLWDCFSWQHDCNASTWKQDKEAQRVPMKPFWHGDGGQDWQQSTAYWSHPVQEARGIKWVSQVASLNTGSCFSFTQQVFKLWHLQLQGVVAAKVYLGLKSHWTTKWKKKKFIGAY